jgi:ACS family tartrate transporter-like MFS transporter
MEIPSNLMHGCAVGARLWIARIMIDLGPRSPPPWRFVQGPMVVHRPAFLLGLAEAGFVPGVILYLTYWFPSAYRARVTSGSS